MVIILLAGVAGRFLIKNTWGTLNYKEKDFQVNNLKDVYRVVLTSSDNKRIDLTKPSGVWMVNNKYIAREELVQSVFEVLAKVTILVPVARAAHDNVVRQLLNYSVKVEVYAGKDQKPEKTFYVGGETPNGDASYMIPEEDGKMAPRPFIVFIPNLRGSITPRFNTDEEVWRTRVLFNYKPEEIKSLSLEYTGDEQNSFILNRVSSDSLELLPNDEKYRIKKDYQQKYVKQYLDFYSSISIEAYDNSYLAKDSMRQTLPYCVFTITEKDNSVNKVKLFHMPVSRRSKMQFDAKGNDMLYDIDHFHASIHNDQDWAVVQYYVFGKLLRNYKDFFFKPEAAKSGP